MSLAACRHAPGNLMTAYKRVVIKDSAINAVRNSPS